MNKKFKTVIYVTICATLLLAMAVSLIGCDGLNLSTNSKKEEQENLSTFVNTVKESQLLLDEIGDEIYSCWFDAVYKDKYLGSIDLAIAYAMSDKQEQVDKVKANDELIAEAFAKCKNMECGDLVKEVMTDYSDYYEFVINVSGSFKSYSADKETKKKALATALRTLSYELD